MGSLHGPDWDATNFDSKPTGANLVGAVASFIQATRQAVRHRFMPEHNFDLANDDMQGFHKQGSGRVWIGATRPTNPYPVYDANETEKLSGRVHVDLTTPAIDVHDGTSWVTLTDDTGLANKIPTRDSAGRIRTATPSNDLDASTKKYVDDAIATVQASVAAIITNKILPIGAVLVQYPAQVAPATLYPDYSWSDITTLFAGAFFRAEGGLAVAFEDTVGDLPTSKQDFAMQNLTGTFYVDSNGTGSSGAFADGGQAAGKSAQGDGVGRAITFDASRQAQTAAETRPVNYTIRIWKRTA